MSRRAVAVLIAAAAAACGIADSEPSSAESATLLRAAAPPERLVAALRLEDGTATDLEALAAALEDPDWVVRAQAVAVLGRVGDPALELVGAALDDENEAVRVGAIASLHMISGLATVPFLVDALADESGRVKVRALRALAEEAGALTEPQARRVVRLIAAPSQRMRRWASLVAVAAGPAAVDPLIAALDEDGPHRWRLAWSLGQIGPEAAPALPRLRELSSDADAELSTQAAAATQLIEAGE